jgi:hypothetical protein
MENLHNLEKSKKGSNSSEYPDRKKVVNSYNNITSLPVFINNSLQGVTPYTF